MIASGASFLPTTCACSGWPVSLSSINARQPQPEWAPYFRRSDARPDALVDTTIKAKRLPVGPPDSLTSPRVIGGLESSGGQPARVRRIACGNARSKAWQSGTHRERGQAYRRLAAPKRGRVLTELICINAPAVGTP